LNPDERLTVPAIRTPLVIALVAAVAAIPLALTGCGGDAPGGGSTAATTERVSLALDWYANADHAGIETAIEGGIAAKGGVAIDESVPSDPTTNLTQAAAGKKDLVLTYAPELLLARAKGIPVKAVGAVVPVPLNAVIARGDRGITTPRDLEGKTVGIAGVPSDTALLDTVVTNAGGDPSKVQTKVVGYSLSPALAAGKVDAIIGGYWNIEVPDLRAKGVPVKVFKLEDNGVPTYDELVLAAGEDTIASNPGGIRRALAAIATGTTAAQGDPAAARRYLIAANPDIAKGPLAAQLALTLPVLTTDGRPLAMDPAQWDALAKWMKAEGLVTTDVSGSAAIDTSLLPEASR
jgi:putative hydroxymethylpyrimidine transport system substrate-binding protein